MRMALTRVKKMVKEERCVDSNRRRQRSFQREGRMGAEGFGQVWDHREAKDLAMHEALSLSPVSRYNMGNVLP